VVIFTSINSTWKQFRAFCLLFAVYVDCMLFFCYVLPLLSKIIHVWPFQDTWGNGQYMTVLGFILGNTISKFRFCLNCLMFILSVSSRCPFWNGRKEQCNSKVVLTWTVWMRANVISGTFDVWNKCILRWLVKVTLMNAALVSRTARTR